MRMYEGRNPFSMSTPSLLLGRSRTCPLEARTSKPGPRYFPMVRALAGDSTMTRFLPRLPERDAGLDSVGSSPSASTSTSTSFGARFLAGALVLTAFVLASDFPRTAGATLAIIGSSAFGVSAFAGRLGFFSVTSVGRVGSAGVERKSVLFVEPVDQHFGRQLLRAGLGVELDALLAGARHDLLELLGRDAAGLVEAEEVRVRRRGEQSPLRPGRDAHVLAGDARLPGIVLAGVGLQRAEDQFERLIHDVGVVPPGIQHLGQLEQRVLVAVHVRLQLLHDEEHHLANAVIHGLPPGGLGSVAFLVFLPAAAGTRIVPPHLRLLGQRRRAA